MVDEDLAANSPMTAHGDSPVRRFALKIAGALATIIASAVFENQFKGQWAPWLRVSTIVIAAAILLYFLVSAVIAGLTWWRVNRDAHRIELQTREPMLACAAMFSAAMSQSFAKSAGSVLNRLHEVKALDARTTNAYNMHLGTIATSVRQLITDVRSKRLPVVDGLQRLSDLHRDYVRLSCEIATAASSAERKDIHRDWDEIRDYTNMISNRLTDLCTQAGERAGGTVVHLYFQDVPRA